MNILNYTKPAQPKNLTHVLDDIFNTGFSKFSGPMSTKPAVNIKENKNSYAIELVAPGLKKENFNIFIEKDQLIVEATVGKTEETSEKESDRYTRREFHFGSFKRSFHISDKINSDKIDAKYEDGILTLTLDKREEAKEKPARNIVIS